MGLTLLFGGVYLSKTGQSTYCYMGNSILVSGFQKPGNPETTNNHCILLYLDCYST